MNYKRYKRLREQVSTNGGITWTDTGVYKKGDLIDTGDWVSVESCERGDYPDLPADSVCVIVTLDGTTPARISLYDKYDGGYFYPNKTIYIKEITENEIKCVSVKENLFYSILIDGKNTFETGVNSSLKKLKFINDINLSKTEGKVQNNKLSFTGCSELEELSGLEHLKIPAEEYTNLKSSFMLPKMKKIDLSMFDLGYVENISYMLANCKLLEELIIPTLDTNRLTEWYGMFQSCDSIKKITCKQNFKDLCYEHSYEYLPDGIGLTKTKLDNITWDIVG